MKFREIDRHTDFTLTIDPQNPNQKILDSSILISDGDDAVIGSGATCKVKLVKALTINDAGEDADQLLALKIYKRKALHKIRFTAPIPYGPIQLYTDRERLEDAEPLRKDNINGYQYLI